MPAARVRVPARASLRLRFRAPIALNGINPYVLVRARRSRALKAGWRKPVPVKIRVNGEPAAEARRINLMPAGDGSFFLYLHEQVRKGIRYEGR